MSKNQYLRGLVGRSFYASKDGTLTVEVALYGQCCCVETAKPSNPYLYIPNKALLDCLFVKEDDVISQGQTRPSSGLAVNVR